MRIIYYTGMPYIFRCHQSYFNHYNFPILFTVCLLRTLAEVCILANTHWPHLLTTWCRPMLFVIIYQFQVISSLLAAFVFQNVILIIMANKVYLNKNYINSLHAIHRSRQIQSLISVMFPLIHLLLLYWVAHQRLCWPRFSDTLLINAFFVTSPVLQVAMVCAMRVIGLQALIFPIRFCSGESYSCIVPKRYSPTMTTRICTACTLTRPRLKSTSSSSSSTGETSAALPFT